MPESEQEGAMAGMEVSVQYMAGALAIDVAFRLERPWTVLFAPSGAGKTTVLRLIAGLLRPQTGRVVSLLPESGTTVTTVLTDTQAGIFVPPHRRSTGLVAQEAALFPHMSVLRNVLYGMVAADRSARGRVESTTGAVADVMELCRIAHLSGKMPSEISGGERQRVALARAIAARPKRLLLLDEPFTGTDVELRDALLEDLRPWLERSGTPVLQVTHDVGDVLAARAEVLLMEGGRIVAQGPAGAVLARQIERLRRQLGST